MSFPRNGEQGIPLQLLEISSLRDGHMFMKKNE